MIKNLVLKGGGVLGQAYTGAIVELDKRGVLKGVERIAATSAGAVVGTLLALKYTPREIFDISSETDFRSFEDGRLLDKVNVTKRYGINPGETAASLLNTKYINVQGYVPANYWVKLTTTTSLGGTVTYDLGQETY